MNKSKTLLIAITSAGIATSSVLAGDVDKTIMEEVPSPSSKLSGSISIDLNSHFMSYGADVWGAGSSATRSATLNPSISIDYALSESVTITSGFWLDANDNPAGSDNKVQETDVWLGVSYASGIVTYSAVWQNWQYGGDSEQILDLAVSFDTFLSPSITLHKRLTEGASGGFDGTFAVLGLEKSFDINDKLSLSIPFAIGFALDDFHTTETGYGYASLGLQGSYAISNSTSFNAGITLYDNDQDITNATADNYFTYNAGFSYSF
ncbi:MAG: hypothetical protein QMC23_00730 [Rubritalea sp.]|tara:strand:- start:5571 stop:6362 length:792 start_codon:yes stop_codon:yes gene_type:complete